MSKPQATKKLALPKRYKPNSFVWITGPNYQQLENFSDGMAAVQVSGKWGFIDTTGKIVIQPSFSLFTKFSEGLCSVTSNDTHDDWAFINKKGEFIFKDKNFEFYNGQEFENGLTPVTYRGKKGVINKLGEIVIPFEYEVLYGFCNGLSVAKKDKNDKFGYINLKGEFQIAPKYITANPFSDGLAFVEDAEGYYFIDTLGKIAFNTRRLMENSYFEEGLAVYTLSPKYGGYKYGFINKKGELVIAATFDDAESFKYGKAVVKLGEHYGLIDKKGKMLIDTKYDYIKIVNNALNVIEKNGKYGIIDNQDSIILKPVFELLTAQKNVDGYFKVALKKEGNKLTNWHIIKLTDNSKEIEMYAANKPDITLEEGTIAKNNTNNNNGENKENNSGENKENNSNSNSNTSSLAFKAKFRQLEGKLADSYNDIGTRFNAGWQSSNGPEMRIADGFEAIAEMKKMLNASNLNSSIKQEIEKNLNINYQNLKNFSDGIAKLRNGETTFYKPGSSISTSIQGDIAEACTKLYRELHFDKTLSKPLN